ncbi:MmpS family protein [Micromonospora sp. DR5-3]|uniref:MmpS family transport accessory protein n=1 Tax=unclassified Micromonospora TaxID=2617518 RepID=UPI0011D79D2B|nr:MULTISPECIES: MmpS family transport accessory protein [unclassified Micromonospora]MCW3817256.1 MmpS family protein [Micromonospora sp. DR5-3]TYC26258.1 hypothetical protein FXF52_02605 [Micromonospora sp. MP36]
MSEPTPTPEPPADGGHPDPTTPPAPGSWTPPDPLAAPQPWAPPAAWSPTPWSPRPWSPDPTGTAGTTGWPGTTDTPGTTATPATAGTPATTGPSSATGAPAPAGSSGQVGAPRPAVPPVPSPAQLWPGYPTPGWPPPGYPPPYAYPGAPPARTNGGRVAAIVVAVTTVLVLVFCGCVGLGVLSSWYEDPGTSAEPYGDPGYGDPEEDVTAGAGQSSPATTPSGGPGQLTVVYEATGAVLVDVQFYDANGDFHQYEGLRSPWRLAITANDRERVQVIASPAGLASDDKVTCSITIDGKVVSRDSGVYGATCFGW